MLRGCHSDMLPSGQTDEIIKVCCPEGGILYVQKKNICGKEDNGGKTVIALPPVMPLY